MKRDGVASNTSYAGESGAGGGQGLGKHKPSAVITVEGERVRTLALPAPLLAKVSGITAEVGILAPGRTPARIQLRDSAGLTPDFPHFSLIPSDEALCCAIHLHARYHPEARTTRLEQMVKSSQRRESSWD